VPSCRRGELGHANVSPMRTGGQSETAERRPASGWSTSRAAAMRERSDGPGPMASRWSAISEFHELSGMTHKLVGTSRILCGPIPDVSGTHGVLARGNNRGVVTPRNAMNLLLLLIILLLLFGGGGFYWGGPRVGGSLGGIILLILIILLLTGRL
jgi:hypothetical protein